MYRSTDLSPPQREIQWKNLDGSDESQRRVPIIDDRMAEELIEVAPYELAERLKEGTALEDLIHFYDLSSNGEPRFAFGISYFPNLIQRSTPEESFDALLQGLKAAKIKQYAEANTRSLTRIIEAQREDNVFGICLDKIIKTASRRYLGVPNKML